MDQEVYNLALVYYQKNKDMEDSIQLATATINSMNVFVTLDKEIIKRFSEEVGFIFLTE